MAEWQIGDFVFYGHGPVMKRAKGRIIDMFDDPVIGPTVVVKITAKDSRVYAHNTELDVSANSPMLHRRKDYNHGN